jgi:hypothetical protein
MRLRINNIFSIETLKNIHTKNSQIFKNILKIFFTDPS